MYCILTPVLIISVENIAHASCIQYSSCSGCIEPGEFLSGNCDTEENLYYGVSESSVQKALYSIKNCTVCESGYKRVTQSIQLSPSCTVSYYSCEEDCSAGCSGCTSTDWAALRTGYQSRTVATCSCTTCIKKTEYRCASGFYGTSTNGTSGCTQCPSDGTIVGTSAAGSTERTSCYIAAGTTFSESEGDGLYSGTSYYCD